jgi:hypothetical protein
MSVLLLLLLLRPAGAQPASSQALCLPRVRWQLLTS